MPDLYLSRQFSSIALACEHVETLLRDAGWREAQVSRASLAVGEAVSNAVEHGPTHPDPIHVQAEVGQDKVMLRIHDGGRGPEQTQITNARLPSDPLALGGRGLFILTQLAHSVDVDAEGTLHIGINRQL